MAFSLTGILAVILEVFRPVLVPLIALVVIELMLIAWLFLRRGRLRVRPAVNLACAIGIVVAVAAAFMLPPWTGASITQLAGLLDYAVIIGTGFAIGTAAALILYPPLQLVFQNA